MRHKQVDDTVVVDKSPLRQCPTLRELLLHVPLIVGETSQFHQLSSLLQSAERVDEELGDMTIQVNECNCDFSTVILGILP
jgi:hypothetical protein